MSNNQFTNTWVTQGSVGAKAANGWTIGPGTALNDVFANYWKFARVQYQDGVGWDCGNSDTNYWEDVWGQNVGDPAAAGRALVLRGPVSPATEGCRENYFNGYFGGNVVSRPLAEAGSWANYIRQNGMGSGAQVPELAGNAQLGWDTDLGSRADNRSGANAMTKFGNMTFTETPGGMGAVFDIDQQNNHNGAQIAKFGTLQPMYLHHGPPTLGMNMFFGGSPAGVWGWKYGKGSSAMYGGLLRYDTAVGTLGYYTAIAPGNADDDANSAIRRLWTMDRFGHEWVSEWAAPTLSSCGTSPSVSGDDKAGEITMGTGSPTTCAMTFANQYHPGVGANAPYCTVTWQVNLPVMQYAMTPFSLNITQTATSSNKINYRCTARAGG
jgi:hypothetical protein